MTNTVAEKYSLSDRIVKILKNASTRTPYEGFIDLKERLEALEGTVSRQEVYQALNDLWYADVIVIEDVIEYDDIQTYTGFEPMYCLSSKEEDFSAS